MYGSNDPNELMVDREWNYCFHWIQISKTYKTTNQARDAKTILSIVLWILKTTTLEETYTYSEYINLILVVFIEGYWWNWISKVGELA
jgi:hypothetical protein